jgi:chaperone required for assembly of F1-ATPase
MFISKNLKIFKKTVKHRAFLLNSLSIKRQISQDDKKGVLPQKLKRIFFTNVSVVEESDNLKHRYFRILLDNKKCKTMFQEEMKIPNKFLAYALAEEWARQNEFINLYSMHLVLF